MSRWRAAYDLTAKLKLFQQKLFTVRKFSFKSLTGLSEINNLSNRSITNLQMNLCNPVRNGVSVKRNFMKTFGKNQGVNQNREKIKNAVFNAGIALIVLLTLLMNLSMERHQDYVVLEPEEENK